MATVLSNATYQARVDTVVDEVKKQVRGGQFSVLKSVSLILTALKICRQFKDFSRVQQKELITNVVKKIVSDKTIVPVADETLVEGLVNELLPVTLDAAYDLIDDVRTDLKGHRCL